MLQSYGTGWQSANFLEQERQFFGAPGGVMHDWEMKTNIDGIYVAGDQIFASDCAGAACATGCYAGRKASDYAKRSNELPSFDEADCERQKNSVCLLPLIHKCRAGTQLERAEHGDFKGYAELLRRCAL